MSKRLLPDLDNLEPEELLGLDYDAKVKLLDAVIARLLMMRMAIADISRKRAEHAARGREIEADYRQVMADLAVLKEIKQGLQSAIKAEGPM